MWLLVAVAVTTLVAAFIASVLINPLLPQLNLHPVAVLPHVEDIKPLAPPLPTTRLEQKAHQVRNELLSNLRGSRIVEARRPGQMKVAPPPTIPPPILPSVGSKPLSIGFYVNWDDASYSSLKRNLAQLDWVVPEWIRLQSGSDPLVRDIDPKALDLIRRERPSTVILPLI